MKWIQLIIVLFALGLLLGCSSKPELQKTLEVGESKEEASIKLNDYYSTMDYLCNSDSDCTVKDVHNCCGYFPQCVNKNAQTDPAAVKKLCESEGAANICGFQEVTSCKCTNQRCTSQ